MKSASTHFSVPRSVAPSAKSLLERCGFKVLSTTCYRFDDQQLSDQSSKHRVVVLDDTHRKREMTEQDLVTIESDDTDLLQLVVTWDAAQWRIAVVGFGNEKVERLLAKGVAELGGIQI